MKKIIFLVLIILIQSCFSYKIIDLKSTKLIAGHKYKIAEDKKLIKARLKSFDDSTATMMVGKTEKQIEFSKIKIIKTRKFSVLKTIALVPIVGTTITLPFVISNPNIGQSIGAVISITNQLKY